MRFETKIDELELQIFEAAKECETGSKELSDHIDQMSKLESIKRQYEELDIKKAENKNKWADIKEKEKADADRKKLETVKISMDAVKAVALFTTSIFTFWVSTKIDMIGSSKSKGYNWFKDLRDKANAVTFSKI